MIDKITLLAESLVPPLLLFIDLWRIHKSAYSRSLNSSIGLNSWIFFVFHLLNGLVFDYCKSFPKELSWNSSSLKSPIEFFEFSSNCQSSAEFQNQRAWAADTLSRCSTWDNGHFGIGIWAKMGPYPLLDLTIFFTAVTRFDHCTADSEARPHSAGFTRLLGLGRGK